MYNASNVNITQVSQNLSNNEIRAVIFHAASVKGWRVIKQGQGAADLQVNVRDHQATVRLSYNRQAFSIQYLSSSNLLYTGNTIHRNYNKWIILLERQIISELSQASAQKTLGR